MHTYATPYNIVRNLQPELPTYCFRPERVTAAARWFVEKFPAQSFYAVKVNPAPHVLDALWEAGIRSFDAASEKEIQLIQGWQHNTARPLALQSCERHPDA